MHYGKKILEFMVGNFKIYTGFGNYKQAEEFAQKTNGELTEIVYHDGKIEPEFSDKAKLVEKKMPFNVELSKDYTVFYSNDEFFEKYKIVPLKLSKSSGSFISFSKEFLYRFSSSFY